MNILERLIPIVRILVFPLCLGVLTVGIGSLLYIGYLRFYPFKTIEIHSPFNVITKQVVVGEDLVYQASYCKYDTSPAKTYRTIVGPDFIPTPIVGSVAKQGCHVFDIHLNIPKSTTPGVYRMDGKTVIEVNPLQLQTKFFETEEFEVIK